MATLMASYHGLVCAHMVFISPGLDVEEIFQSYCDSLNLNSELTEQFHQKVGDKMSQIAAIDDVWNFFRPAELLKYASDKGLLVFDHEDEEVSLKQFKTVASHWQQSEIIETHGLGHFRILKDLNVNTEITSYIKSLGK